MDWLAPILHRLAFRRGKVSRRRFAMGVALLGLIFPLGTRATDDPVLEYKVKAGFLYNFAKFVEWPEHVLPTLETPIIIGVLAEDPAAPILQQVLQDKLANGRPIVVKLFADTTRLESCQMLFLGRSQKERVGEILERLKGMPVLTVGEFDQFAHRGGMMNFVRKEDSFRFEVNLDAAERGKLKVSAKLASMAILVQSRK